MNAVTIETTESIEKIVIFNQVPKKSFVQLYNWLAAKLGQKLPATEKNAWGLLAYLLSLEPKTVDDISPKSLSSKTGHSVRSIERMFKFLLKVGHMRIVKVRDSQGRFIKTEYEVYSVKNLWRKNTNWRVVEIIDKNGIVGKTADNKNSNLQTNTIRQNWQEDEIIDKNAKNQGGSYTRARVISSNTRNTTNVVGDSVSKDKKSSLPTGSDFFDVAPDLEKNRKNWILINSIKKYFGVEKGFEIFKKVFDDNKRNTDGKIKYLWGAVKNKINEANEKQQSLNKPTAQKATPVNPQKSPAIKEQEKTPAQKSLEEEKAFRTEYQEEANLDDKYFQEEDKYLVFLDSLSEKQQLDLIKSIIPKLDKFTINRLRLKHGPDKQFLRSYFSNGTIRAIIREEKLDRR